MKDLEQVKEATDLLKNKKSISIKNNGNGWLLFDAKNDSLGLQCNELSLTNFSILISTDRMANQCVKDIPEVAWDMMDYATTPLTLILDGGQFVSKSLINSDGSISIQKVTEGILFDIVNRCNRPIACVKRKHIPTIEPDLALTIKSVKLNQKIMRVRLNGEIEIIAN